jgi:hypothetical protein
MRTAWAKKKYHDVPVFGSAMLVIGALMAILAVVLTLSVKDLEPLPHWLGGLGVVVFLLGFGLWRLGHHMLKNFTPDNLPLIERKRTAEERTWSLAAFAMYQESKAQSDFQKHVTERRALPSGPEPYEFVLWLAPTCFINGGEIPFKLPTGHPATLTLAEDTEQGTVLDVPQSAGDTKPFRVRVFAMRVHPDEQRLE